MCVILDECAMCVNNIFFSACFKKFQCFYFCTHIYILNTLFVCPFLVVYFTLKSITRNFLCYAQVAQSSKINIFSLSLFLFKPEKCIKIINSNFILICINDPHYIAQEIDLSIQNLIGLLFHFISIEILQ